MQQRQRIEYIDYMRGIAIILVVMGHLIQLMAFPLRILYLNSSIVFICLFFSQLVGISLKK